MQQPLKVFISYSHQDDALRIKLVNHLALLVRQNILELWHDRCLIAGESWGDRIDDKMRSADIVLLLISADFIQSDYCYGIELETAMQRRAKKEAVVVPVILRDCDWHSAPFGACQAVPRDGKAIANHPNGVDSALTEVAKSLRQLAQQLTRS